MPLYSYKAINDMGRTVKGNINGANEVDLENRLKDIGLDIISYSEKKDSILAVASRITNKDLILLCIHLEQLERAGVPILDSLADLRDTSETPKMKNLMAELYESVRTGNVLSAAMAAHPTIFDDVFIGLIQAGEKTGQLSQVLWHLGEHLKWNIALKKKVKKATTYPVVLLIMMAGIIAVMMLYVVPQLSDFLTSQSMELPPATKALIATSHAVRDYWYLFLGVPIFIFLFVKIGCRMSESFSYTMDNFKLNMPVLGTTIRKIEMARFCRFFSITFKSGIGILDCLEIASGVVNNRLIKESIVSAGRGVFEGNSLTLSLRIAGQFPNLVLRMFKVGEDSGNLEGTLETVNFFYDKEVNEAVENLVAMVQPALTLVLGAVLAWVVIAVFGPLYGSFATMKF